MVEEWNGEGGEGGAGEGGKAEEHGPTHEHLQAWRLGLATSRRASFRLGHPTVTPKLPTIFLFGNSIAGWVAGEGGVGGRGGRAEGWEGAGREGREEAGGEPVARSLRRRRWGR